MGPKTIPKINFRNLHMFVIREYCHKRVLNQRVSNKTKMRRFVPKILKKHQPVPLGRWNTAYPERKSELANHDHCGGPQCSKVALTKYYDSSMDLALCALQSFQLYPSKK